MNDGDREAMREVIIDLLPASYSRCKGQVGEPAVAARQRRSGGLDRMSQRRDESFPLSLGRDDDVVDRMNNG